MEDMYEETEEYQEEVSPDPVVRLKLMTHNARLIETRVKLEMTQRRLGELCGLSVHIISVIETLKQVPSDEQIEKIACVLCEPIDYLFPEELLSAVKLGVFDKTRREVNLNAPQVLRLAERVEAKLLSVGPEYMDEEIDRELLAEEIRKVFDDTLTQRERQVLEARYGLTGRPPMTYEETGKIFDVTRERVRQIESKALRKLRHPAKSRRLMRFLSGYVPPSFERRQEEAITMQKYDENMKIRKMWRSHADLELLIPKIRELRKNGCSYARIAREMKSPFSSSKTRKMLRNLGI